LSDYYIENYYFNADFSTIAYVFVFLIDLKSIWICLFPSVSTGIKCKKTSKKHIGIFLHVYIHRLKSVLLKGK